MMMKHIQLKTLAATALAIATFSSAHAQLIVSEVSPYSSGNTPFAADWFELTNTGTTAMAVSGWTMDDNSNAFASSVPMTGINSIAAGESVIFIECAAGCAAITGFQSYWGSAVAGVQFGTYSGSGVGLSTAGDAVNVFNSSGTVLAHVDFGASTVGRTFDNAAGLNNATLTTLSSLGVNGAFNSTVNPTGTTSLDIGSPGRVAAVPEPDTYAMMLVGLLAIGSFARRRQGRARNWLPAPRH
jgi:hypothetical protein